MDSLKIITNAFVITCDPYNRGGLYNLLIRNDRIEQVSDSAGILTALFPDATVIDASNKLIIPGFVNAHFHSESVLLRPHTENLHFSLWNTNPAIQKCIAHLLDPLNKDDVRNVYQMSYFQHLKSGTTCVGEYGLPFPESGFNQMMHSIERTEVKCAVALQDWDQISKAGGLAGGRHRSFVNVGTEDEFTVYRFESLLRASKEWGVPLVAHVAEQRSSAETIRKTFQKGILAVLQDFGVVRPDTLFIHLNHMSGQEVEVLAEAGATVVVCARSAAFKRTGYPLLRHLARERVRLAVGTDWGTVDMLEELKFLFRLPLLVSGIPPLSPLQLVRMGTINGAHALGFSQETGSIEVGKKADLTFYALQDLRVPSVPEDSNSEALSLLLLDHLTNRDISDVMINGEFYIAQGEVMTMSEEELVEAYQKTASKFSNAGGKTPSPALPQESRMPSPGSTPRILPFTSGGRASEHRAEGFELGFRAGESPASTIGHPVDGTDRQVSAATTVSQTAGRTGKEQAKGVWRTFGEEDF